MEEEYAALLHELKAYRPDLLDKPRILAITKMDLKEGYELDNPLQIGDDVEVVKISSATGYGIDELKELIWRKLQEIEEGESL